LLFQNSQVQQGRYIAAFDQDVGDPNPIRFELAPTANGKYIQTAACILTMKSFVTTMQF